MYSTHSNGLKKSLEPSLDILNFLIGTPAGRKKSFSILQTSLKLPAIAPASSVGIALAIICAISDSVPFH